MTPADRSSSGLIIQDPGGLNPSVMRASASSDSRTVAGQSRLTVQVDKM